MKHLFLFPSAVICIFVPSALTLAQVSSDILQNGRPLVIGVTGGGGTAINDNTSLSSANAPLRLYFANIGFRFAKVMTAPRGQRSLRSQLEIASELIPFWQATYPKQELVYHLPSGTITNPNFGFTTRGVNLTPVQLRVNFVNHSKFVPWGQIACGVLFTNRDFPFDRTASVNFRLRLVWDCMCSLVSISRSTSLRMPFTFRTAAPLTAIQE